MGLFDKNASGAERVTTRTNDHAPETISPDPETVKQAVEDGEVISARKVEVVRNGRQISDIPLNDAYWEAVNAHQQAHARHAIRIDVLKTIKGKPIVE